MSAGVETPTYYERWGPVGRRVLRAGHRFRFAAKRSLGLQPRILVEIKWRLGDEVMALPIYEALRTRYPSAHIEVLCNFPELLEDNPFVDAVNSETPSPDRYFLLREAARDVYRLEYYARHADDLLPESRPRLYCAGWKSPLLEELPRGNGPLVAIATGGSWNTKRWPRERWSELFTGLEERGYRLIVLGTGDESLGVGVDFVGRTSVREAAILLHCADALVCSDSGLMHVSLAAGTPVVALFGPTDPEILVRDEPLFHPVTNERECQGCWNGSQAMREPGVCPLDVDECLGTITVSRVAERLDAVLTEVP